MSTPPVVLVDMDGVLADLETAFWDRWAVAHPDLPQRADADTSRFLVLDQVGRRWADEVHAITGAPGFFRDLAPVDGAVAAMREMLADGIDVRICTAPLLANPTCASDKLGWADRHLGDGWSSRVVVTRDKTLVRGDLLVDDKPDVTGVLTPTWRHVAFDAPANRTSTTAAHRLRGWATWRRTLTPLLGRTAA